ncbi:hypothetical protein JW906_00780 [bacterium]|nr:hypothetical protein [bacterium]
MRFWTWPNRVTLMRIGLLFIMVFLVYDRSFWPRLLAALLAILVIVMDWLDNGLKIGMWCSVITAVLCLVRGIPVIIEGLALIREKEA